LITCKDAITSIEAQCKKVRDANYDIDTVNDCIDRIDEMLSVMCDWVNNQ
jgi:hypothetical protein